MRGKKKRLKKRYPVYDKIKTLLFDKKMTYEELATQLNISTTTLSNKLNGEQDFWQTEIIDICKQLEIPNEEVTKYFFAS